MQWKLISNHAVINASAVFMLILIITLIDMMQCIVDCSVVQYFLSLRFSTSLLLWWHLDESGVVLVMVPC
jgi:hypothetical protein